MGEFSRIEESTDCPDCGKSINITIEQVVNGELVTCPGCGERFKLKDEDGGANKLNQAMRGLEDALDNL